GGRGGLSGGGDREVHSPRGEPLVYVGHPAGDRRGRLRVEVDRRSGGVHQPRLLGPGVPPLGNAGGHGGRGEGRTQVRAELRVGGGRVGQLGRGQHRPPELVEATGAEQAQDAAQVGTGRSGQASGCPVERV